MIGDASRGRSRSSAHPGGLGWGCATLFEDFEKGACPLRDGGSGRLVRVLSMPCRDGFDGSSSFPDHSPSCWEMERLDTDWELVLTPLLVSSLGCGEGGRQVARLEAACWLWVLPWGFTYPCGGVAGLHRGLVLAVESFEKGAWGCRALWLGRGG